MLAAARGPQYFEAPKHAATLKTAMNKHGFTDAEQDAAYFGNWCRDMSQALVPALDEMIGHNAAFSMVNLLAIRQFGHGVTPAQLGAYCARRAHRQPRRHDRPGPAGGGEQTIEGYPARHDPLTGTAAERRRTRNRDEDLTPENIKASFEVDAAGMPEYIDRSKEYILDGVRRGGEGEGRPAAGCTHLGNFSHTCEDLFAHSNWIEIAVGRLIGESQIKIPDAVEEQIAARMKAGKPPIEDYAAQAVDMAGNARPILATGTFTAAPRRATAPATTRSSRCRRR